MASSSSNYSNQRKTASEKYVHKITIVSNLDGDIFENHIGRDGQILKTVRATKFSPTWVVKNSQTAPGFQLEVISRIRQGVKKSDWKQLINRIGSTEKEFESILPSSISSMQKKEVYDNQTSERIYELAQLYGLGYEVFDTESDFKNWLMTPNKALGNKIPFELLDSSLGFEIVENEIKRIQHNVYA